MAAADERAALLDMAESIKASINALPGTSQPTPAIISRAANLLDQISAGQRQSRPAVMLGQANESTNTNAKAHVASFLNNITPYLFFARKKPDI